MMAAAEILAAGGVLWRTGAEGAGIEVALVHRPRYDDWSLPKGKLDPGEHALLGAVREVEEETGHRCLVGRPLGRQHYTRNLESGPVPKTVWFWAMRAEAGQFQAGSEVDELSWLTPDAAGTTVTMDRDRDTLAEFVGAPVDTVAFGLVRHASAGSRTKWTGADAQRPLDETGRAQAAALRPLLDCYGFSRVLSADVLRCLETVGPYASDLRIAVETEPLLSEAGYPVNPEAALARCLEILKSPEPLVMCSQGRVMPDLLAGICHHFGYPIPADTVVPKGSFWVLHLAGDRLVAVERQTPTG
jgi:8-oxo-dGTP pyrophosphatase MutT (NUDIX family)/phosphohistidine phosphatase SixA